MNIKELIEKVDSKELKDALKEYDEDMEVECYETVEQEP